MYNQFEKRMDVRPLYRNRKKVCIRPEFGSIGGLGDLDELSNINSLDDLHGWLSKLKKKVKKIGKGISKAAKKITKIKPLKVLKTGVTAAIGIGLTAVGAPPGLATSIKNLKVKDVARAALQEPAVKTQVNQINTEVEANVKKAFPEYASLSGEGLMKVLNDRMGQGNLTPEQMSLIQTYAATSLTNKSVNPENYSGGSNNMLLYAALALGGLYLVSGKH